MAKIEIITCNNCKRVIAACVEEYQDKDWCDLRDLRCEIGYTASIVDSPVKVMKCGCPTFLSLTAYDSVSDKQFLDNLENEIVFRLQQRGLEIAHYQLTTQKNVVIDFDMYANAANEIQALKNREICEKLADAYINKDVDLYAKLEAEVHARGYEKVSDFQAQAYFDHYGNFATLNEYMQTIIKND